MKSKKGNKLLVVDGVQEILDDTSGARNLLGYLDWGRIKLGWVIRGLGH